MQFLKGEIKTEGKEKNECYTHLDAIEAAGIDWVELAERQHKIMMEDLAWALKK
ncbi:MAG: hypothetical protein WC364_09035 [Eubacteriales bacterium]|jgi:hypothetical protein